MDMEFKKYKRRLRHWAGGPLLWVMIIPLVILDLCAELFHHICFPLYGLPLVKRSQYIRFDRHKLSYLTWPEKFYCEYCAYANGLLYYVSKIAAHTERYWCSIKHEGKKDFIPPPHHSRFLEYGDAKGYRSMEGGAKEL